MKVNKKKLFTMLVAVALVAIVGVGATLAYFTGNDTATNVVTMGNVNIDLLEDGVDKEGERLGVEGMEFENVLPGVSEAKEPYVKINDQSADCYVRVKVQFTDENNDMPAGVDYTKVKLSFEDTDEINPDWFKSGDYYYYKKILSNKEANGKNITTKLFTKVTPPASWGNDFQNKTFELKLVAEAIQAEGITPTKDGNENITGWKGVNGEDITME